MGRSVSNQQSLARLAKRLSIPLEHNPLLEDEHGLCGCVQCYLAWTAKPPPDSKLEQRVMPLLLAELFQNGGARSPAINLLLQLVAEAGANVVEVSHIREGIGLHVGETGLQIVLETRSREHGTSVIAAMTAAGYKVLAGLSNA